MDSCQGMSIQRLNERWQRSGAVSRKSQVPMSCRKRNSQSSVTIAADIPITVKHQMLLPGFGATTKDQSRLPATPQRLILMLLAVDKFFQHVYGTLHGSLVASAFVIIGTSFSTPTGHVVALYALITALMKSVHITTRHHCDDKSFSSC